MLSYIFLLWFKFSSLIVSANQGRIFRGSPRRVFAAAEKTALPAEPVGSKSNLKKKYGLDFIMSELDEKTMSEAALDMPEKDKVIESCHFIREQLADCSEIDAELDRLNEEAAVVAEMVRTCIQEKATATQTQADFAKKYSGLVSRHEAITAEIDRFSVKKGERQTMDNTIGSRQGPCGWDDDICV